MKTWLKFALRTLVMLLLFFAATVGFLIASKGNRFLDLVERERTRDKAANVERLDEMAREYSRTAHIGYGVMAVSGILFLWICFGLVKKGSETRKAGIVVVSLMGVLACYMTSMATYTHFKIKRVRAERADVIDAKANLAVAHLLFENGDWPRAYSNIVSHLERTFASPECNDPWGHGVLAECYLLGRGCEIDLAKCRNHAEAAAKGGDDRGKDILERLDRGEKGPPPKPNDGIRDLTGVDVTAIQLNPRRNIEAERPLGFFKKGWSGADAQGKINHIGFLGNLGNGCAMTNGIDRLERLFPELCRRLDCELYQAGTAEFGLHWWVFRLTQTKDWLVQFRLYNPKGQSGADAPLLVTLDICGLQADGFYNGTNSRFEKKQLNRKPPLL